jgi:hypothetical protein|tara:strand:- start:480 stop:611 length:132 start_codon:yes stop_codon:yes gene_type:complete
MFIVVVMGISLKYRGAAIIVGDPHYSRGNVSGVYLDTGRRKSL